MNTLKPMGLLASGRMTDSTLAFVPQLASALGPIVASSKRLASRYANTLRMGCPASSLDALAPCRMIWIQAPAADLGPLLEKLLAAPIVWVGKFVVLLDPDLDSLELAPLARAGASVASLTHAPLRQAPFFVAEGEAATLRALRPIWRETGHRVVELRPGLKPAYCAGLMAAQSLAAAVAQSSLDAFRLAGLEQSAAKRLTASMVETSVRDQLTHGRRLWISPGADSRREATHRQLRAVRAASPELGALLQSLLATVLAWNHEPSQWIDSPRTRPPVRSA